MDDHKITFRKITPADLMELQALSRETFYDAFSSGNTDENMKIYTEKAFSEKQILEELNDPETVFYFALAGDQFVGYLKLNSGKAQAEMQGENGLELARIYVQKQFQGHKIGKKMLDKTIDIAKQKKADFVWLGVWEKNPAAIRFYERNGFVKFSSHFFMVGDDRQTDILMKLKINH